MTHPGRSGLTLVELVIAISLSAIIGLPVGVFISEYLRGALQIPEMTIAMSLARDEMERLDSLNDVCHADLALTSASPAPTPSYWLGYPYALTRIVQCQAGDCTNNCAAPANDRNGIKRIELRVTRTGRGELLAAVVTYRTKFVLWGS